MRKFSQRASAYDAVMAIDRRTLSLAAPALGTTGSLIGFLSAVRARKGMTGALLGLCASLVWATMALQDEQERRSDELA